MANQIAPFLTTMIDLQDQVFWNVVFHTAVPQLKTSMDTAWCTVPVW